MKVKNKELYDTLNSLTKVVLEIASRKIESELSVTTKGVWKKREDGSFQKHQIRCHLWSFMLHDANDEIVKTKEYLDFIEVLHTDEVIAPQLDTLVGSRLASRRLEPIDIAMNPVYKFLTDEGIVEFSTSPFNSTYSKIESALYSDEIPFENVTPLCGFTMDDSEISLTENISIVKLSDKEIIDILALGATIGNRVGDVDLVHKIQEYAIKTSYMLPKIVGERDASTKDLEQNEFYRGKIERAVVDALRIYKEGKLYPIITTTRGKGILSFGVMYGPETPANPFMRKSYNLLESEVDEFRSLLREKNNANLPEKNFLSVGIRRFSQSNERDNVEDRIIDLMISAEAIFLSSGGSFQGELKYRLSHRAAMFIETDAESQKKLFKFMQKAYDVRSDVVHGSNPKLPKKADGSTYTLEEFCGDIERYLRISIKKAISKAATAKDESNAIEWEPIIFPPNS